MVADRVVRGQSSEGLLDRYATSGPPNEALQHKTADIQVPDPATGPAANKTTVIEALDQLDAFDDPTVATNAVAIPNRPHATPLAANSRQDFPLAA